MKYWYDTEFIEDGKTIDLISIGVVAEDGREYYAISTEFDASKASDWVRENVLSHLPSRLNPAEAPLSQIEAQRAYRSRGQIAGDLIHFFNPILYGKPELWGYYSAYDHLALCQLFGTMMNLPKSWPMYTRDIKQLCDSLGNPPLPVQGKGEHHALADARWNRQAWEFLQSVSVSNDALLYIPGEWQCKNCGFRLSKRILGTLDGAVVVDPKEVNEPCPNDGTAMARVTWKEEANDFGRRLEELILNKPSSALYANGGH